jgi:hypothetical protein
MDKPSEENSRKKIVKSITQRMPKKSVKSITRRVLKKIQSNMLPKKMPTMQILLKLQVLFIQDSFVSQESIP